MTLPPFATGRISRKLLADLEADQGETEKVTTR